MHANWVSLPCFAGAINEFDSISDLLRDTQPAQCKPFGSQDSKQKSKDKRIGSGKPNLPETQEGDDSGFKCRRKMALV